MNNRWLWFAAAMVVFDLTAQSSPTAEPKIGVAFPRFRMQEIAADLKVGYAVLLIDLNGDGKKDIVVVDTTRVVWYENPTWKRRTIIEGQTKPDNVCIAAYDIDGDGKIDLALGADWKPFNTKEGGTLQWLKRGQTLDDPWTLYPIDTEPTVHRIRFADVDGSGKARLIVVPLMGRNSSQKNNWIDGEPVRVLAYTIPRDPVRDRWVPEVLDQSLHVIHNFQPIFAPMDKGMDILLASYEGVNVLQRSGAKWTRRHIGATRRIRTAAGAPAKSRKASSRMAGATLRPSNRGMATRWWCTRSRTIPRSHCGTAMSSMNNSNGVMAYGVPTSTATAMMN